MNNEPPKVIHLTNEEFDALLEECRNAKGPNEALRRATDGLYSDIDPDDPNFFEKRIEEKERKRKLLYSLPPEFAEERLRQAKAQRKRKLLRTAFATEEQKIEMLKESFKRAGQEERDGTLTDGPTFFKELESGKYDEINDD